MHNTGSAETLNKSKSVTRWIGELKVGDEKAVEALWTVLQRPVLNLARRHIKPDVRTVYDEEDVAQSAFGALCELMRGGHYENVCNRDELWRLLAVFVLNKVRDRNRYEKRLRRGGNITKIDLNDVGIAAVGKLPAR